MDTRLPDRLRRVTNLEVVRRLLCGYFVSKLDEGISPQEGFDRLVYPPTLQDLPFAIPQLAGKVEIEPHMRDVRQMEDTAEIGWNLFVLGTHRKYLGETYHTDLRHLATQIQQGAILEETGSAGRQATPREIVSFILNIMGSHREGYVNLERSTMSLPIQTQTFGKFGYQSQFFRRSGAPFR